MHLWPGYCPTHYENIITGRYPSSEKETSRHTGLVHPECRPDAKAVADAVLSTGGMMPVCT